MFRHRHTVLYTVNTLFYFIYLYTQYAFCFVFFFHSFLFPISYSIFFLLFRLPPPRLDCSICGGTFPSNHKRGL